MTRADTSRHASGGCERVGTAHGAVRERGVARAKRKACHTW
jgi:hypothetical protein